jgi:hypothetical protein
MNQIIHTNILEAMKEIFLVLNSMDIPTLTLFHTIIMDLKQVLIKKHSRI